MSTRLDSDLARLLDAECERPGPRAEIAERLLARLEASIALPPTGSGDPGSSDPGSTPSGAGPAMPSTGGGSSLLRALVLGTTTMVVGVAGGVALDRLALSAPTTRVVYVDRIVHVSPAPSASASTVLELAPSASSANRSQRSPEVASAAPPMRDRDRELAAERVLVETARTALGRGDGAAALATLDQHARRFPSGQLREEREALAVQSLDVLARRAESRERAQRFKQAYPASMFMPIIDASLAQPR